MDWPKSFRTVPGLFDFTTFELSIGAVKTTLVLPKLSYERLKVCVRNTYNQ